MKLYKKDIEIINDNLYPLDLNYLKIIYKKMNIDYNIYIEKEDNSIKKINGINHKEFIINDIMYYLQNNKIPKKTIYNKKIQNYENTNNIEDDYIYYGQYNTTNKKILKLLKSLTNNEFKFGGISQKLIKSIWKKNKLITYKNFAKLWLKEYKKGTGLYKELAYNQCIKNKENLDDWIKIKNNAINIIKKYGIL